MSSVFRRADSCLLYFLCTTVAIAADEGVSPGDWSFGFSTADHSNAIVSKYHVSDAGR